MPNTRAAKKALRQTKKRMAQNKVVRDAYKDAMKTVKKNVEAKKEVGDAVRDVQKKLGKAAKKGVIKKRTAARKLSRLMKKVGAMR